MQLLVCLLDLLRVSVLSFVLLHPCSFFLYLAGCLYSRVVENVAVRQRRFCGNRSQGRKYSGASVTLGGRSAHFLCVASSVLLHLPRIIFKKARLKNNSKPDGETTLSSVQFVKSFL